MPLLYKVRAIGPVDIEDCERFVYQLQMDDFAYYQDKEYFSYIGLEQDAGAKWAFVGGLRYLVLFPAQVFSDRDIRLRISKCTQSFLLCREQIPAEVENRSSCNAWGIEVRKFIFLLSYKYVISVRITPCEEELITVKPQGERRAKGKIF